MSKCSNDSVEAGPLTVAQTSGCCEESGCISLDASCNCGFSCNTTPYYEKVSLCPEDNTVRTNIKTLVGSIKNRRDFAMPACGAKLDVEFSYAGDFPIGAWLWASGYGFLTIIGFNSVTKALTLRNDCPSLSGNLTQASVGTPIPACTTWTLTVPQTSSAVVNSNTLYPYLNSGFVAPANGLCIDVILTNVNGLSVGKKITLNSGVYRVSEIKNGTLITICNDGQGLVAGTNVDYKNSNGDLIVPVVLIDSNPCLSTTTASGVLLVCDAGVLKPMIGNANGQIPVFDISTNKTSFRTVSVDVLSCTQLTQPLTVDPSFPDDTAYLATVGTSGTAIFTNGDIAQFGVDRFTVDSILTGTTMRVTPIVIPGGVTLYPVGTAVCTIGLAEQLQVDVEGLRTDIRSAQATPKTTGSIAVGQTINGNEVFLDVANDSPSKAMNVFIQYSSEAMFNLNGIDSQYAQVGLELDVAANVNPALALAPLRSTANTFVLPPTATTSLQSISAESIETYIIPPNTTWRFRLNCNFSFGAGNAAALTPVLNGITNKIAIIGVSEF